MATIPIAAALHLSRRAVLARIGEALRRHRRADSTRCW
jgi:hypothetical protein